MDASDRQTVKIVLRVLVRRHVHELNDDGDEDTLPLFEYIPLTIILIFILRYVPTSGVSFVHFRPATLLQYFAEFESSHHRGNAFKPP